MGAGGTGTPKRAADHKTVVIALVAAALLAANIALYRSIFLKVAELTATTTHVERVR